MLHKCSCIVWGAPQQMAMYQTTRYYATYEEREDAFGQSVFSLFPRKYSGPGVFWSDFQTITASLYTRLSSLATVACITSNPRDCLALGTPWQELSAAILRNRRQNPFFSETQESVARAFDLTHQLMQPVRTLSGGEAVKLALAKAWIFASCCQKLAAASPCNWLSQPNRIFFDRVLERFSNQGKEVVVFALEGEDSNQPIYPSILSDSSIDFEIVFQDVQIPLGDPLSLDDSNRTMARISDSRFQLTSPCLILGDNGQGKSLLAKILSGSISCEGRVKIDSGQGCSRARLLFQDMTTQILLRSFNQIVSSAEKAARLLLTAVYQEIIQTIIHRYEQAGRISPLESSNLPNAWCSLLELKAALVASRLLYHPAAIILDEPDWGLSRFASAAFVRSVISAAHQRFIPVILITHKPWWDAIAKSGFKTSRSPITQNRQGNREFLIALEKTVRSQ
ncbi:MAG TPA: ATP-binding cassette domain-containing protein [Desulfatirhabdiaceae bacterium]|nr:ATP-binding cassette domain-containing protein [Desulfatirhabdiaceae bacterium]